MAERTFAVGETIFREGDSSHEVALIREGLVEVVRKVGDGMIVLGRVGAGEAVGEMGVLERRARSATVRAIEPVQAVLLDRDAFLARMAGDPGVALALMKRLCERLHAVDDQLADAARTGVAPAIAIAAPNVAVRLLAASEAMHQILPADGLAIAKLPFRVGRREPGAEALDLALDDQVPYRLSRLHFAIDQGTGGLVVHDTHSTLGTEVDGKSIGEVFPKTVAVIGKGEHRIVAGGEDSPFVFRVVVG